MTVVSILFHVVGVIGVGACGPDMLVGPLWSLPVGPSRSMLPWPPRVPTAADPHGGEHLADSQACFTTAAA